MQRARRYRELFKRQMNGMCAAASIVLLCSLGALLPGMAAGQTFDAPALVTADETGAFCYDATFTAGPGGFDVMLITIDGWDNTDIPELFDEPFCSVGASEGESLSLTYPAPHCPDGIGGSLVDIAAEGSVSVGISNAFGNLTCRGDEIQSFGARTAILPFQPLICFDNSVCALGRYCEKLDGCDHGGTCADRPTTCPPPPPPGVVCGCDGVNYDSVCEAARRGVSIDFDGGPCLTITPTPTATPTPTPTATPHPWVEVDVDIKPGSDPNSVNLSGQGTIAVAIVGSPSFSVANVDVSTLAFGPGMAAPSHDLGNADVLDDHLQDVNGDGLTDLVSHYRTQTTGIASDDRKACMIGATLDGTPFEGCDAIRVVSGRRGFRR